MAASEVISLLKRAWNYIPDDNNLISMTEFLEKLVRILSESLLAKFLVASSALFMMYLGASRSNINRERDVRWLVLLLVLYAVSHLLDIRLGFTGFALLLLFSIFISQVIQVPSGIFIPEMTFFLVVSIVILSLILIPTTPFMSRIKTSEFSLPAIFLSLFILKSVEIIMRLTVFLRDPLKAPNPVIQPAINETRMRATLVVLPLIALFSFALQYQGITQYIMPTYGNTMYHFAFVHYILIHGDRTLLALEYGGTGNNYYVPGYRYLLASLCRILHLDTLPGANLFMIMFSLWAVIPYYLLVFRITGSRSAGCVAAFLSLGSKELQIYTVRPLPQALALSYIAFTLYLTIFLLKNRETCFFRRIIAYPNLFLATLLSSLTVTYLHPQSQSVMVFTLAIIGLLQFHRFLSSILSHRISLDALTVAIRFLIIGGIAGLLYLHWHYLQTGTTDPKVLAPYRYSEFSKILGFKDYLAAGDLVVVLFILGIYFMLLDQKRMSFDRKIIVLGWVFASLMLSKNELLGIKAHTERYLAFVAQSFVVIGSIGLWYIQEIVDELGEIFPV